MDGRGGECCVARYAGGGAYNNNSQIDRIMLRYRPIAPKPVVSGSSSGGSSPDQNDALLRTTRVKRKYVRDGSKRCGSGRKRRVVSEDKKDETPVLTLLSLLPEEPGHVKESTTPAKREESPPSVLDLMVEKDPNVYANFSLPIWLNTDRRMQRASIIAPQPVRPVGSCVIFEGVTDTWTVESLGCTDEEKMVNLLRDTCPGFISDSANRVRWTNEAYGKMVNQDGEDRPEIVWLVMKDRLPWWCEGFACRVRLQYTCKKEKNTLTVPCDVWKMEGGKFAWRLDVKAALSLGR